MPALLMSLILSVCLVGSGGEPTPTAVQEPVTMDIDTATGHIVLPVWIEGDGPYWFVLDTGNQNTTIFAYVAEDAGIETEPLGEMGGAGSGSLTVEQASDVRVSLGDSGDLLSFTDAMVTVLPDAAELPAFNGKRVAGFLGASLIERYITSIDYGSGELVLTDREAYEMPDDAKVMQIKIAMGFPYFEGQVTPMLMGKKTKPVVGNFLLDLGATYAIDIDYEEADTLGLVDADDPDQQLAGQGRGIDGVMFEMRTAPLAEAELGGLELNESRVLFMTTPGGGPPIENLVGNVGSGLFMGDRVTLDYEGGRLIWEDR
tara:strand:- start:70908 stop:71855 length:948 start_codon:yes stop_codon:yes gene_type:complete